MVHVLSLSQHVKDLFIQRLYKGNEVNLFKSLPTCARTREDLRIPRSPQKLYLLEDLRVTKLVSERASQLHSYPQLPAMHALIEIEMVHAPDGFADEFGRHDGHGVRDGCSRCKYNGRSR